MKIKDWKFTPLYLHLIEGESELESYVKSLPESELVRIANISRDPTDPFSFNNKVLIDVTLKKTAELTEVEYWLNLMSKRDFSVADLVE
jgi:hypothetical protein